jgi:hypothetical protein
MFLPLSITLFTTRYRRNRTGCGAGIGQGSAKRIARPATRNSRTASDARLCLAKYPSKYVGKYRQKYRRLGTHLHRQMRLSFHLDLNLDLNRDFYPSLLGALLKQLFKTLFGLMFKSKFAQLYVSMGPALYRQRPGGRRPVGRGVGGRIVVQAALHHYPKCMCYCTYAPRMARPPMLERRDPATQHTAARPSSAVHRPSSSSPPSHSHSAASALLTSSI